MPQAPKIPHNVRDLNDWSNIADGQLLKRVGTGVQGVTPGDVVTKSTGKVAGTVAAGDDPRLTLSILGAIWS
jgi:hypothetical protein